MAKKFLSALLEGPLARQALQIVRRLDDRRPNQLLVLTYHAVTDAAAFEAQVSYLAANYHVVQMRAVVDAVVGPGSLPPRALLITFDDAYRSFETCAWPLLKEHGLPATMFVATAFPDAPQNVFWWDRLEDAFARTTRRDTLDSPAGRLPLATEAQRRAALKQLKQALWRLPQTELLAWVYEICGRLGVTAPQSRVMGWEALRRLQNEGVTLAPHSRTHPDMSRLSLTEARQEIAGSLADLEREVGPVLPIFAYPGGHYNEDTVRALGQENFLLAFGTLRGTNDLSTSRGAAARFKLRRNHIAEKATLSTLQARLLYGSRILNRWHALRRSKSRSAPAVHRHREGYAS